MRRYPSFHPVPVHNSDEKEKSQYWQILNCARPDETGNPRTRAEIRASFQDPANGLFKVSEDGNVGHRMANDLLSITIALGLLDGDGVGDKQVISWTSHTESYMSGESEFSETLLKGLEHRMWKVDWHRGDQILIELLLDIHKIMDPESNAYLSPNKILERLDKSGWDSTGYGTDGGKKGAQRNLREALKFGALLQLFSVDPNSKNPKYARFSSGSSLTDEEDDEEDDSSSGTYLVRNALRRICVYWQGWTVLKKLGTSHKTFSSPEGESFLNRLFIYHIFRECRGHGDQRKHATRLRKSFDKFTKVLKDNYEGDRQETTTSKHIDDAVNVKHSTLLNVAKHHNAMLKSAIQTKYELDSEAIPKHITIDALQRAYYDCEDQVEVLAFFERNAGARYDVTILSDFAEKHVGNPWSFTGALDPYEWQIEATNQWNENGNSGIVAAVTGSGKTIMAMHAVSDYLTQHPDAVVSVIVPTKVLMYQWAEIFAEILGLDEDTIGLRGDGFKDNFQTGKRVVVSIIDSARQGVLEADVEELPDSTPHLLIADECHRYGGEANRTVFDTRHDAVLGLSATPPADEEELDEDDLTNAQVVLDRIGGVFYNLRYKEALEQKLISPFEVQYVTIPLQPHEDILYVAHSKRISKAIQNIRMKYGHAMDRYSNRSIDEQLNALRQNIPDIDSDKDVNRYRQETQKRRDLVWGTDNRKFAYLKVVKQHPTSQMMVFHERISQLEDIVAPVDKRGEGSGEADKTIEKLLVDPNYTPAMYHSKQTPGWNPLFMQAFREGKCRVMLSVKALAEGVDVPKADVGIIRVSTGSVRQRIQTIGRMLRRGAAEKAMIYIFHVTTSDWEPTVDCNILRNVDWEEQLGDADITCTRYMPSTVDENGEKPHFGELVSVGKDDLPIPESWEDRRPPAEVDVSELNLEDAYPGRYEGKTLGVDSRARPFIRDSVYGRIFIENSSIEGAARIIHQRKGGGKLLVTPQGHLVTRVKGEPTIFLGSIEPGSINSIIEQAKQQRATQPRRKARTFEEMFGSISTKDEGGK